MSDRSLNEVSKDSRNHYVPRKSEAVQKQECNYRMQLDSDVKFYIIAITLYNIMKVEENLYVSILPIKSHNLILYSGNNLGI